MKDQDFKEDPRYRIAAREAWMAVFVFLLNFLWWFAFAFGLGDQPPQNYTFIMGFPAWFFYSVILGLLVFCILVYIMVNYFYTDMPLGPTSIKAQIDDRR